MTEQRVFTLRCPNCHDPIVLRHRNPLGTAFDPPDRAKDKWPLRYWCNYCGLVSVFQELDIHEESFDTQGQSSYTESLWCFEFVCVQENSERHFSIYSKQPDYAFSGDGLRAIIEAAGLCPDTAQIRLGNKYGFPLR